MRLAHRIGCPIDWFGHEFQLLADRGVYWPEHQMLLVADTHFGKEASFRAGAVPVPSGPTASTLEALRRMIDATKARQVLILGDVFHARSSFADSIVDALDEFFDERQSTKFQAVLGNHDLRLAKSQLDAMIRRWRIGVSEKTSLDGLTFQHHPVDRNDPEWQRDGNLISGHLHPAVSVGDSQDRLGKLPCFWSYAKQLVLPAVGYFTGSHRIEPKPGDRIWVIADDEVVPFR